MLLNSLPNNIIGNILEYLDIQEAINFCEACDKLDCLASYKYHTSFYDLLRKHEFISTEYSFWYTKLLEYDCDGKLFSTCNNCERLVVLNPIGYAFLDKGNIVDFNRYTGLKCSCGIIYACTKCSNLFPYCWNNTESLNQTQSMELDNLMKKHNLCDCNEVKTYPHCPQCATMDNCKHN